MASPCVGVCRLDRDGAACTACGRTLDEIAGWSELDEPGRRAVMAALPGRLAANREAGQPLPARDPPPAQTKEPAMTEIRSLSPHDALPGGHSVVLMRRFAEDAPDARVIEMIVTNPDRSEETSTPTGENGAPLSWEAATEAAKARAVAEGLKRIWTVDRTAGDREQEILLHHGDHTTHMETLQDTDPEDGERGSDMRDRGNDGAPRRF